MFIRIEVIPESRNDSVVAEETDRFVVAVRAKAEQGQANRRVLELLRQQFRGKRIRLVSGHHSSHKIVSVE